MFYNSIIKLKNNIINYTESQVVILCIFINLINEKNNSCYAMEHIIKRARRTGVELSSYSKYFTCKKFTHKEELQIFLTLGKELKKTSINSNISKASLNREELDNFIEDYGYNVGKLSSNEVEFYEKNCREHIINFNTEAVSFLEKLKIPLGISDSIIPDIEVKPITEKIEPVPPVKDKPSVLSQVNESLKEPSEVVSRVASIIEYGGKGLVITMGGATALDKAYKSSTKYFNKESSIHNNNVSIVKKDPETISEDKIKGVEEKSLPNTIQESTSISDWWPPF
jgi:hypothetical protein